MSHNDGAALVSHAERLVRGANPNDFVGAAAFVVVMRRLSELRFLDVSGPFERFDTAQTTARTMLEDLAGECDDGDYFVEVRPIFADERSMFSNRLDASQRPVLVALDSFRPPGPAC